MLAINTKQVNAKQPEAPEATEVEIQYVTGDWVLYNVTQINATIGTVDSGNITATYFLNDGDRLNISETIGSPAWLISFNWTDVDQDAISLWVVVNAYYSGNLVHDLCLELYNFTASSWSEIGILGDMTGFEWVNASIYVLRLPNDVINSTGAVLGRIIHNDAGNINHVISIDYLKLNAFIPFALPPSIEAVSVAPYLAIGITLALAMLLLADRARR